MLQQQKNLDSCQTLLLLLLLLLLLSTTLILGLQPHPEGPGLLLNLSQTTA
jgi:hypothetical protein